MDLVMKAAPKGSAMRWIYDNQIEGNEDAGMPTLGSMFERAFEEPKVARWLDPNF